MTYGTLHTFYSHILKLLICQNKENHVIHIQKKVEKTHFCSLWESIRLCSPI